MIKLNNITKQYDNKTKVLKGISVEFPEKGLISIVGESGSGKSTLLNIIGGLDNYNGEILYNDKKYKAKDLDLYRQDNIGVIFQNYLLFDDLTVYQNLDICLKLIGINDKEEIDKRIEYVLRQVGMYKMRKKLAKNLSGGQQQRISIARALLKNTKVLLADEPTGNLDRKNTIEIMNILKKISKTTLVILVTHNKEMANAYSDDIIGIVDGLINNNNMASLSNNLNDYSDDIIYLEDYNKEDITNDVVDISIFGKKSPANIKIIFKDNRILLTCDKKIEIISEQNVKEKHEEIDTNDLEQISFDTSWYNNLKTKSHLFSFKDSVKAFFKAKGIKTKLNYIIFFILGIILAISIANIYNSIYVDTSDVVYVDNAYSLYPNTEHNFLESNNNIDIYNKVLELPNVSNYTNYLLGSIRDNETMGGYINKNDYTSIDISLAFMDDIRDESLICGNKDGLVISSRIANDLFNVKNRFENSLGREVNISKTGVDRNYIISGVINDSGKVCYLPDYDMSNIVSHSAQIISGYYFDILPLEQYTYSFVEKPLDLSDQSLIRCYILEGSNYEVGQMVGSNLYACGYVNVEGLEDCYKASTVFVEQTQTCIALNKARMRDDANAVLLNTVVDYEIVEGTDLTREDTISVLAPINCGYKVGDSIKYERTLVTYEIVGLYRTNYTSAFNRILISKKGLITAYRNTDDQIGFKTSNLSSIEEFLEQEELNDAYYISNMYDYQYNLKQNYQRSDLLIYGGVSIILFIVYVLFVYFVMRSKVLSEQYEIAVYRSLGARKETLISSYLKQVLVLTLFTTLTGYILSYLILLLINLFTTSIAQIVVITFNIWPFLIGIVIMFILNILVGVLPIILNLKKTPAELISKYDL